MNTPNGKAWDKRRTNQRIRRVLKSNDWVKEKVSGRKLNTSMWGCGLRRADVQPRHSADWHEQLDFEVTRDTRYWDKK